MKRILFLFLAVAAAAGAQIAAVDGVGMTVADLDRSVAFFRDVLTFAPSPVAASAPGTRQSRVTLGGETLELTEFAAKGRPFPEGLRSNDRSFQHVAIVVSDMKKAFARLQEKKVELITQEPQRLPDWNPNAGGIEALYFRDPDGHPFEIIRFPAGKGDPKWQRPDGRIFLGIDHTAIVVADTDASLVFYRDVLGLQVAGTSMNSGPEQERLNAVSGARLRITALRAPSGFGIELLEYLSPEGGRPMPEDARANDVLHREIVLRVASKGARPASRSAASLRDPDGHPLKLLAPVVPEPEPRKDPISRKKERS